MSATSRRTADGAGPPRLTHTVTDGVATVVISNPAKRNAMTAAMWRALPELLDALAADPAVRVLVLTGDGETFCAGADIASLREPGPSPRELAVLAEEALAAFPRPTLAAVRGHCAGGGCQLAAACDLRFAEEGALFAVPPARLGVVYPPSAVRRLVALTGPSTAKYLLFSGEPVDTARALRTGLVDEVLPPGGLAGRVAAFTAVLTRRSLLTQTAAKEFVAGDVPPGRAAYWERQAREQAEPGGDTAEGVAAFLERRTPRFTWTGPGD
ncbi:enoyl-CoA hydratase/isomerase family protein [Streptomyces clavuligerus]|uniref:enoyl-CoA hydratase/isomerase family protein n=1 Tax=Streptomyces clavuligerus TaxID=1901 RepID=UPI0018D036DA|nr:enoyl-CoA hydratase/isomerase family protein [Streptomyces clavuligerus]